MKHDLSDKEHKNCSVCNFAVKIYEDAQNAGLTAGECGAACARIIAFLASSQANPEQACSESKNMLEKEIENMHLAIALTK